jgi:hypothetical protein
MTVSHVTARLATIDDQTFLERVPLDKLFVAPYGRPVGAAAIGRMLKQGFDTRKLGIVTLSLRADGRFAVIDGWHRVHLCRHVGLADILARVFIDLTYEEEASLFSALNTIKPPTALDRFRSRVESGEPTALGIKHVLDHFGMTVTKRGGTGAEKTKCVSAIVSLERIYEDLNPEGLATILDILIKAWDYDGGSFSTAVLDGMRHFMVRYRREVDLNRLVAQLQRVTPSRLLGLAGVGVTSEAPAIRVGKQVAVLYNRNARGTRLPEWTENFFVKGKGGAPSNASRILGSRVVRAQAALAGQAHL